MGINVGWLRTDVPGVQDDVKDKQDCGGFKMAGHDATAAAPYIPAYFRTCGSVCQWQCWNSSPGPRPIAVKRHIQGRQQGCGRNAKSRVRAIIGDLPAVFPIQTHAGRAHERSMLLTFASFELSVCCALVQIP
jgi:hypothetical protein